MSRRSGPSLDHAKIAKAGFLAGLGPFAAGVVGEFAGHSLLSSLPETVESALLTMEVLGVVVGFFVPVVFGAVLPLAECQAPISTTKSDCSHVSGSSRS